MKRSLSAGKYSLTLYPGRPQPLGATITPTGLNFAVYSAHAAAAVLVLFEKGEPHPLVEIPLTSDFRVGHIFAVEVTGLDPEAIEYGYRMEGPHNPAAGHLFDPSHILLDPYARQISGRNTWGKKPPAYFVAPFRSQILTTPFDWEGDRPLRLPFEDLIIYEMHVRSFTRHPSAQVEHPGTYAGIIEKVDYLKALGVNCVELLPIHEFDEFENTFVNPLSGERLWQYWGYGTIGFFAPKAGFAASGAAGGQVVELKSLVKTLHQNGIEVILDVVFNHTGEGGAGGHAISFRGLDNKTYYMLTPDGHYYNFTGTGNTVNCNHPVVREMIIQCLRYWVTEYHIDGFRFDLASIMVRDGNGQPMDNPPLIEAISRDGILAGTKLIAEAWDAAGLYQVGTFPHYGRWSEWNGKYRDVVRRFLKGDEGQAGEMVQRILGSPDLYQDRAPGASINFITCHDGFTLNDLFSYNQKHNEANGENNRDGNNDNNSWNCGEEGPSENVQVNTLRYRLMRSAVAILLTSQGVPMFHMGDEIAHTKRGNNNTYGHDNELNWFNWKLVEEHHHLLRFFRLMIAFRKVHPALRSRTFLSNTDLVGSGYPDISWHGVRAWQPDWSYHSHTLAYLLCGRHVAPGPGGDDYIFIAINMHWKPHVFAMPELPDGLDWYLFADTARTSPHDICEPGSEAPIGRQTDLIVESHSLIILVGR